MLLLLDEPLRKGGGKSLSWGRGGRRARTCAWYSMLGSCRLLRQIAHVSVSTFHDHTATAFHFLTRNLRASLLSAD